MLPVAPQPSPEAALDGQASQYFASLAASVQGLQQRAQQLLNRVNDSREEDQSVMSSFKENLLLKVGTRGWGAMPGWGWGCHRGDPSFSSPLIALFRPN